MGNQYLKRSTIWKVQYAPRDKAIKNHLSGSELKRYRAMTIPAKIQMIDNLQAKGVFKKA